MATALPTETRAIRMDPELSERVEALLMDVPDSKREKARKAVMNVYHSAASGTFDELLRLYDAAIEEAAS